MNNNINFDFEQLFYQKVEELDIDWDVRGVIANNDTIYALGNDSKLLGRIFEIIAAPVIKEIAEEYNLICKIPDSQNTYPDFTLMRSEDDENKIAIDIKTTYYNGPNRQKNFTLGSFTSFLRDDTKNIEYPYSTYSEEYTIGFMYTRNMEADEGDIVSIDNLEELDVPYLDVDFFVRRKQDINGDTKGSGNTDNMSSIKTKNFNDFKNKIGPFSNLPQKLYLHYWRNYSKYTESPKKYKNLDGYFEWLENSLTDPDIPDETINQNEDLLEFKQLYLDWKMSDKARTDN